MSFLDKINAAKNTAAAAEKKVNPLLLKRTPVTAASAPEEEKAVANGPAPVVAAPVAAAPAPAKVNPLMRKATAAATATTEAAPATTVAPAAKPPTLMLNKNKAVEVKATAAHEEPKTEEVPAEAPVEQVKTEAVVPVEETVAAEEPVVTEETSADVKEEAPKTTAKNKAKSNGKKAEKAPATDVSVAAASEDVTEMPESTMSFNEVAEAMSSPMIDEEWATFRDNIEAGLDAIVIDMDMNPGTLKVVLSELNEIYDQIAQPLHQARTLLDNLTNKEDGAIQVIKSVNTGSGNNDMERKKAGYIAVMNHKPRNGGSINLFDAAAEARSRYNFLKGIYDRIQYKNSMLITMNGALKLERDFTAAS
jgi:chemotaxis protein histidine kinase CheA